MGKNTGFLEYERKTAHYKPVKERIKNYKDFIEYLSDKDIQEQAARCMDCGVPFCHAKGCPVYNLIPEWNDLIYQGKWQEALKRLELTNSLPEITGRICPAPCETSCTLSINNSPVTIKQIELAIIEKGFKEGWVKAHKPQIETGKKIAIIGSGPAGLGAAQVLRRLGHNVTVFEKSNKIGGILRYGIPDFKLEKWVLDRRIKILEEEGVKFKTGVYVGKNVSAKSLKKSFNAVLVTTGAEKPRDLPVPGRELEGIYYAMDFLTRSNKFVSKEISRKDLICAKGKNVLVIGGGDTGSDCIGTSIRQGAKNVYQFEIMPKPREWQESYNPQWPEWPIILRTSSSHEEGVERDWSILTKQFIGKGKKIEKATFARVEWKADKPGARPQMQEIPGSEFTLDIDYVFLAMGFLSVEHNKLLDDFKIKYDERNNIKTNNYMTNVAGVFAAGDADIGASLVVRAIYHGQEAAKAIDGYLQKKKK